MLPSSDADGAYADGVTIRWRYLFPIATLAVGYLLGVQSGWQDGRTGRTSTADSGDRRDRPHSRQYPERVSPTDRLRNTRADLREEESNAKGHAVAPPEFPEAAICSRTFAQH